MSKKINDMIKLNHLYKYIGKKINFFIFIPLYISSFNILSNFFEKKILGSFSIFGDFLIYRCAGINYLNKESPYGVNKLQECLNSYPNSLDFFYPPITLSFFKFFSYFEINQAIFLWGLIVFSSLFLIVYYSYKFFGKNISFFIFLLIFLFSFGGINWTGIITGNISILIYGLISLGIFFIFEKKNNYFYILISLISLIKPTYFIFILLPILISETSRIKELKKIFLFFIIVLFIYLLSYLNNPDLFNQFINSLVYARSSEFISIFGQGLGLSSIIDFFINSFLKNFQLDINYSLTKNIIWLVVISLFISYFLMVQYRKKEILNNKLALSLCLITLCYPILKHYECYLVVPCLFFLISNFKTKFKYILLLTMFSVHDKYSLFLILIIAFTYEIYLSNKKISI